MMENREVARASTARASRSYVSFEPGDPANPRNWPSWRKWLIVLTIVPVDLTVSWAASGISPASKQLAKDFHVSSEVATLGLSITVLGFAIGPMILAPLSERYGRSPLYIIPYGIFLLFLVGTALVKDIGGFLILRFLSGLSCSMTIANFGGTIADLWPHHQTGYAMSVFLWAAVCGSPSGFFLFSFIAATRPWQDIFWALLGICGGLWIILTVVLLAFNNETRHSVLLARRARHLRKTTGNPNIDIPPEMRSSGLVSLFKVTLSRPFRFLTTEAIIIFGALYNGYLYGLSFLFNDAFTLVYGPDGYGFGTIGIGLSFLGLVVGISLGPLTNLWQERYYVRHISQDNASDPKTGTGDYGHADRERPNIPEARVQLGKVAAVAFPISLFWFAWTCSPSYHVHWISPILATTLFGWSFYTLILMTYMYTEDSYKTYSASALAGLGLVRNTAGAGFPLFGVQLFNNLGYQWAGSLLAFLSLLLIPIPFVLEKYGERLRRRSPWAREHMSDSGDEDDERKRRVDMEGGEQEALG